MNPFLVVAHPGYELRLYHWLERAHPTVSVLTDGSVAGRPIRLFDYAVTERFEERGATDEIVIRLDEDAAARKLAAAYAYSELRSDVDDRLRVHGAEQMRLEVLRPAAKPVTHEKPFYEKRGQQQVAAGRYQVVLRYGEHLPPFVAALREAVRSVPLPATRTERAVPVSVA